MAGPRDVIAGKHAVRSALQKGRRVRRVYLHNGLARAVREEITALASRRGVKVSFVDREWLDARAGGTRHQGVVAEAETLGYVDLDTLLRAASDRGEPALVLALDQVQDPHNLGAIIRTGAAAGAHGVVIPERRSAGLSAGTLKAAAGAAEWFPVARVTNLGRALDELKRRGLWAAGADPAAETPLWDADFRRPLVLVIGGEDRGLGRLVRGKCDFHVRIPMQSDVACLNASVAAGVLLFEALRQRSCAI